MAYTVPFRKADLRALPHLPDVRLEPIADALSRVMPRPVYLPLSALTGEGMDGWLEWLDRTRLASPSGVATEQMPKRDAVVAPN